VTKVNYIRVRTPDPTYVAPDGASVLPYTNWATAASNLQDAVNQALSLVIVSNGTYGVTEQVLVDRGVTVRSLGGAALTTVRRTGGTTRLFNLSHSNAVVEGFTIADGNVGTGSGGGVTMTDGTLRDCVITNNYAQSAAGGIRADGGLVERCTIIRNWGDTGGEAYGGGVYLAGTAKLRNCLLVANRVNRGGGVFINSASTEVDACTIVGNGEGWQGGGVFNNGSGQVRNTIVVSNSAVVDPDIYNTAGFTYSCSPTLASGTGNLTSDPSFRVNGAGYGLSHTPGDYRLRDTSPCVDRGTNQAWMIGARHLGGGARIVRNRVDMGVYEQPMPGSIFTVR
jgi:hypothetical protein